MNKEDLEYSYSNGQYWSKYDHCRVWNNGTYDIIVKDKYGQTTITQVEITNNHKVDIEPPVINSGDYIEGTWSNKNITLTVMPNNANYFIDRKITSTTWSQATVPGVQVFNFNSQTGQFHAIFRCRDEYGNVSPSVSFLMKIDKTAPTNINFVPTVTVAKEILTNVSAIDSESPIKYSITYDNGVTWSEQQIGNRFGLPYSQSGSYMVNCRAYNATGAYVEGTPINVTIS